MTSHSEMTSQAEGDAALTVLPEDELRRLVLDIIIRDDIEPFLRRMVSLLDSLKTSRFGEIERIARQSADPSFKTLLSAVSDAAARGHKVAAYHTAFLAAGYAYQQSLDHVCELMSYLDRFRQGGNQRNRSETAREG
jgi:hypothetical protein